MVSAACDPPPGVALMIGWGGPPMTAVSATDAGTAGGGCHAGINVVDSCAPEPMPEGMVAAIGSIGSAATGAGVCGACMVAATADSQGGGASAGGSAVTGASGAVWAGVFAGAAGGLTAGGAQAAAWAGGSAGAG